MEYVVPARIHQLQTIDPGEIRLVQLLLPEHIEIAGTSYEIRDLMRPGTAFLAKPWGGRTKKYRRRMYTRSNSAQTEPRLLETIVNFTHQDPADTSLWWQSEMAKDWFETGKTVDVRIVVNQTQKIANVYENTMVCKPSNLRLEEDGEWEKMQMVCVAFGTGITPFLSYIRYMAPQQFGRTTAGPGIKMTLIASVRHAGQLMLHEELLALEKQFPQHFRYQPVLTRAWPDTWAYLKGRILRVTQSAFAQEQVDIAALQSIAPDLAKSHIRVCGSLTACQQITLGLEQSGIKPFSLRTEAW